MSPFCFKLIPQWRVLHWKTQMRLQRTGKPLHPLVSLYELMCLCIRGHTDTLHSSFTTLHSQAQTGVLGWLSNGFVSALPQPANSPRLSRANSEARVSRQMFEWTCSLSRSTSGLLYSVLWDINLCMLVQDQAQKLVGRHGQYLCENKKFWYDLVLMKKSSRTC